MKFLIDTQLPPSLEAFFSWKGHYSKHTIRWSDGQFMDDKTIISIAQNEDYIIVTKDKDFQSHYLLNGYPPAVLWLSFGNVSNAGLLSMLSTNFDVIEDALISGGRMVVLASDRVMIW